MIVLLHALLAMSSQAALRSLDPRKSPLDSPLPEDAFGNVSFTGFLKVESRPQYVWRVRVSNAQGIVGWLANPKFFDGMDSCE